MRDLCGWMGDRKSSDYIEKYELRCELLVVKHRQPKVEDRSSYAQAGVDYELPMRSQSAQ